MTLQIHQTNASGRGLRRFARELQGLQATLEKSAAGCLVRRV